MHVCIANAQWRQTIRGGGQPKTATIQICRDHLCYVFHLPKCCGAERWGAGELPPALREFLLDASCKKVGCNISGDVKKLQRDFQVCADVHESNAQKFLQSCFYIGLTYNIWCCAGSELQRYDARVHRANNYG